MTAMIGNELTVAGKKFVLETYIGHGSFGDVYRAVHDPKKEYIAVKILPKDYDYDSHKALLNEISLAGKVSHPNVVAILASNLDHNHPLGIYLAMEYVSGGTLKQKLLDWKRNGDYLAISHAGRIMLDIAQGAKAINETLCHRDIKPDNILFDGYRYKIADFGISKVSQDATRDSTFKGVQHPRYMAPENWLGEQNTEKMDIYSVGLLFYEILTFKHPLETFVVNPNSHRDWETAHTARTARDIRELRAEIDSRWAQLLLKMTSRRPEARPTWDEIINIVDGTEVIRERSFKLDGLITAATISQNNMIDRQAKQAEEKRQNELKQVMIEDAIDHVATLLDEVIQGLSDALPEWQFRIEKGRHPQSIRQYYSKNLQPYVFNMFDTFFPRQLEPSQDFILAAGYIGPIPPRDTKMDQLITAFSANLILVERSIDDKIGEWRFAYWQGNSTVRNSMVGSKVFKICRGWSTPESLFPSPLELLNRQRLHQATVLTFRTDVQQAFSDLLEGAIGYADAFRS